MPDYITSKIFLRGRTHLVSSWVCRIFPSPLEVSTTNLMYRIKVDSGYDSKSCFLSYFLLFSFV